ncbi:uncharacterized protein LOC130590640 [Beta vulgaris subsp. vulgaris]|uniref:uncharacterized protein LOC130590640 n=1 Tax=Beta vulgaris subsp. vulgaris TaxID=3555 RepID=UPI002546C427|nr:uncharacterized protein LOC130590640 [Beta vulgaris subsp. vulgaris]
MEEINNKTVRTFWKSEDIDVVFSPSRGNSGGILAIWNTMEFKLKSHLVMQHWIAELQLLEITATNKSFTWFRSQSKSVLDRLIVSSEWITQFPSMKVAILKRGLSDHCPLHVHTHTMDWGPKPFKFHNCWLADPNCLKLIRESWTKQAKGTMPEKLKAIKQNLKEWNCSNFGNIDANIRRLEDVISEIDNLGRQKAQSDLWEWMKRKEVYWDSNQDYVA